MKLDKRNLIVGFSLITLSATLGTGLVACAKKPSDSASPLPPSQASKEADTDTLKIDLPLDLDADKLQALSTEAQDLARTLQTGSFSHATLSHALEYRFLLARKPQIPAIVLEDQQRKAKEQWEKEHPENSDPTPSSQDSFAGNQELKELSAEEQEVFDSQVREAKLDYQIALQQFERTASHYERNRAIVRESLLGKDLSLSALFKTYYEPQLEALHGGAAIRLNRSASDLVATLITSPPRLNSYSGTLLNDVLTRSVVNGEQYQKLQRVMIFTPHHGILPGYVVKVGKYHLYGIDTTKSGRAIVYFGPTDLLDTEKVHVVDSNYFAVIDIFQSALKDTLSTVTNAFLLTAARYDIPLNREQATNQFIASQELENRSNKGASEPAALFGNPLMFQDHSTHAPYEGDLDRRESDAESYGVSYFVDPFEAREFSNTVCTGASPNWKSAPVYGCLSPNSNTYSAGFSVRVGSPGEVSMIPSRIRQRCDTLSRLTGLSFHPTSHYEAKNDSIDWNYNESYPYRTIYNLGSEGLQSNVMGAHSTLLVLNGSKESVHLLSVGSTVLEEVPLHSLFGRTDLVSACTAN